ncbi:hypothetical protein MMPV_003388 [Pyropia vietnamensis]
MAGEMRRVGVLAAATAAVVAVVAAAAVSPVGSTAAAVSGAARQTLTDESVLLPINHRINCGGFAIGEGADAWTSDEAYTNTTLSKTLAVVPPGSGTLTILERVRYSVRYVEKAPRILEYTLPVLPETAVEVRLGFSEVHHDNPNERVLYVELWSNGTMLNKSRRFDILADVGKFQPAVHTVRITPISDVLTVRIIATLGNPVLSSIATDVVTGPTDSEVSAALRELNQLLEEAITRRERYAQRRDDLRTRIDRAASLETTALKKLAELEPRIALLSANPDASSALIRVRRVQAMLSERRAAAAEAVDEVNDAIDVEMKSISAFRARVERLLASDATPAEMVAALESVRADVPADVTLPLASAYEAIQAFGNAALDLQTATENLQLLLPALPEPTPDGPLPTPIDDGSVSHSMGHNWGDGWFKMLNAGAPGSDDVDGITTFGNVNFFPRSLPVDYETLSYTEQVASTSMFAAPLQTFGFRFDVPLPGNYEVIIGWREPFFSAAGARVMDVSVATDMTPSRVLIRDLDVWSKTQGRRSMVTAHLPGCGHKPGGFEATSWVEVRLTGKVDGPIVNAIIVRQLPFFESGSAPTRLPGSLPPAQAPPSPSPTVMVSPLPTTFSTPAPQPTAVLPVPAESPVPTVSTVPIASPVPTAVATPQSTPDLPSIEPLRINMGGPTIEDFIADGDVFASGTWLGMPYVAADDILSSVQLPVDQTIRWGASLSYNLTVPVPGMYEVNIASVELFHTDIGERVFNVSVEVEGVETLLASNVDLIRDYGRLTRATWTTEPLRLERVVTVRLVGEVDNACVSAIWMVPVVASRPVTPALPPMLEMS